MLDAILGSIGSIGSSLIGASAQDRANTANITSAREQMAFQGKMSNTSYQRATADMRAAGINPMLAYMKGGADSPSGAAGSSQGFTPENPLAAVITTSLAAKQNESLLKTNESQIMKNIQDTATSAAAAKKISAETTMISKGVPRADLQNKVEKYLIKKLNDFSNTSGKDAYNNAKEAIDKEYHYEKTYNPNHGY